MNYKSRRFICLEFTSGFRISVLPLRVLKKFFYNLIFQSSYYYQVGCAGYEYRYLKIQTYTTVEKIGYYVYLDFVFKTRFSTLFFTKLIFTTLKKLLVDVNLLDLLKLMQMKFIENNSLSKKSKLDQN